ncbi:hypothetical protein FLJC2902T_31730 [Flavobacterium limnosediminis JC2902]|uniref:Uncharacterized protein n=1 Tax=Flavobacterium limnosediminis JC2902 TaxID=1341181 RepID=V6SF91_9FLAO|nr:hypothetical protein [Flavobacterium limnosediminis]ESU25231.1 hypothetical protein FLJC2902T_31730 [Flavobacterium limnosediminis JC2902]
MDNTAIIDNCLIGFYASFNEPGIDQDQIKTLIWGENGLRKKLKSLKWQTYGQDFHLILFQIYVKPIPYLREALREIENYRKKEKSIGISIILDDENFFNLNEAERQKFVKTILNNKLDLLSKKIKSNNLDLDIEKLKIDIDSSLNS